MRNKKETDITRIKTNRRAKQLMHTSNINKLDSEKERLIIREVIRQIIV